MLFITIALSLILIALIVTVLRTHQQQRHKDLAEREQSLPPLDASFDEFPDKQPAQTMASNTSEEDLKPAAADTPAIDVTAPDVPKDWKESCREHRQARRFEMALLCSEKAWPQAQSYEQAALTLRAAVKQAKEDGSPDYEKWLTALYRAAAESSMLYDRIPGEPDLRWQVIARTWNRDEISEIDLPWQTIGGNELRLLTKTDRKLMTDAWGEPAQHISARTCFRPGKQS